MPLPALNQGSVFSWAMSPYTDILGPWAYAVIMGLLIVMVYLKTQSYEIPSILAIIGVAAFAQFMPAGIGAYLMVLFSIAGAVTLMKVFKS